MNSFSLFFESIFFIVIFFAPFILLCVFVIRATEKSSQDKQSYKRNAAELEVSRALHTMDVKMYVIFDNLILRSNGNTTLTEIDHVVVSPYGIFCIETKSHNGNIYGYTTGSKWKQYLGNKSYSFQNPYHQNYKHIKALENLLGPSLKTKIHSYVVFPYARHVKIDEAYYNASIDEVVRKITVHKSQRYNLQDCKTILKTIAYASSRQDELRKIHIEEVRRYLNKT